MRQNVCGAQENLRAAFASRRAARRRACSAERAEPNFDLVAMSAANVDATADPLARVGEL